MDVSKLHMYTNSSRSTEDRVVKKELGKDDFLQLLVAQLRNQDPLEPMDDMSFIAQMAQFSSLEQLHNMNDSIALMTDMMGLSFFSDSVSYIGKTVSAIDPDTEEAVEGVVSKVKLKSGIPYLVIGDKEIPALFVQWVSDGSSDIGGDEE